MNTVSRFTGHQRVVVALCALAALVAVVLGGCGGSDSSSSSSSSSGGSSESEGGGSASGSKVTYVNYGAEIPFFQEVSKGAEAAGAAEGLDFQVSTSEIDPSKQLDSFENAVAQQPDGLILSPLDGSAMVTPVKKAVEDGIPVVLLADTLTEEVGQLSYVGANFTEIGKLKAEYLISKLGKGSTVAIVNGPRGLGFVEEQVIEARKLFEEAGIEVVEDVYTKAVTPDEGLTATENILTSHPEVGGIYYSGDDSALGGINAVSRAGIEPGKILLVGTDGSDAAIEAIEEGTMAFTVAQCAFQQGEIAVRVLSEYLASGKEPAARTETPIIEVDTENVAQETSTSEWKACEGR